MPPPHLQSTPTKLTHPCDDGEPLFPTKLNPCPPQSPIRFGPPTSNGDAKVIAERRQARQSLTPTKPLAKFDSLCEDSKEILNNMTGMFSPVKVEREIPELSPFNIRMEAVPEVSPVKKGRRKKDDQGKGGQPRKKKVIGHRKIGRRT